MLFKDIDAHVAGGDRVDEFARNNGSGETGFSPIEGVLGAVAGDALCSCNAAAAADDALVTGHADVHLRSEAVGKETHHGKPATRVEKNADGIFDRGELDTFNRAGVGSLE